MSKWMSWILPMEINLFFIGHILICDFVFYRQPYLPQSYAIWCYNSHDSMIPISNIYAFSKRNQGKSIKYDLCRLYYSVGEIFVEQEYNE